MFGDNRGVVNGTSSRFVVRGADFTRESRREGRAKQV
jgi:hypothetical protein